MPTPIITLLSDFGPDSAYTAMLKGKLWQHCPPARIVELAHGLNGDDPFAAAFFLLRVYSYYPTGTVHWVVIDRGRAETMLLATAAGQHFLACDDGALGLVLERWEAAGEGFAVRALAAAHRGPFAARDWLAPIAAGLACGADPAAFGVAATSWRRLSLPRPAPGPEDSLEAQVLSVDRFGNLILNVTPADLPPQARPGASIGRSRVSAWRSGYAAAPEGECFLYWGAETWLEIAVAGGSAARRLRARCGTRVRLG
jgi:S-adenosylmethionine hydrolase